MTSRMGVLYSTYGSMSAGLYVIESMGWRDINSIARGGSGFAVIG
jgi:hypothetical protein